MKLPAWLQWLQDLWDEIFKPKPEPEPKPPTDLDEYTFVWGRDVSKWAKTITISSAGHNRHKIWFEYDRLQDIPIDDTMVNEQNVNGNCWLIREFEGVWYCGTFDWLRKGQMSKEFQCGTPQFKFDPKPGDKFGIMVSTMARNECDGTNAGGVTYRERSNVFWLTW
jgi:hypothetical protein